MYSKIAFASSTRVLHRFRFSSSICIDDQNDSIIALSSPSPTVPNEGISPAERIVSPEAQEVNCVPWSAWTTPPGAGSRFFKAMSSALITSFVSGLDSIDQPSKLGYYRYKHRSLAPTKMRRQWLTGLIEEVHTASRGTYGYRRVHAELTMGMGVTVSSRLTFLLTHDVGIYGLPGPTRIKRLRGVATADDLEVPPCRPQRALGN